jgi:hypothetical protein
MYTNQNELKKLITISKESSSTATCVAYAIKQHSSSSPQGLRSRGVRALKWNRNRKQNVFIILKINKPYKNKMTDRTTLENTILSDLKFLKDEKKLPSPPLIFIYDNVNFNAEQDELLDQLLIAQLDEMWDMGALSPENKFLAAREVLYSLSEDNILVPIISDFLAHFNWDTIPKEPFLNFIRNNPSRAYAGAGISPIPVLLRAMTMEQLMDLSNQLELL